MSRKVDREKERVKKFAKWDAHPLREQQGKTGSVVGRDVKKRPIFEKRTVRTTHLHKSLNFRSHPTQHSQYEMKCGWDEQLASVKPEVELTARQKKKIMQRQKYLSSAKGMERKQAHQESMLAEFVPSVGERTAPKNHPIKKI